MNITASATRTRLWSLDLTRVVAVVGVAAIHVFSGMVTNTEIRGSLPWWTAVAVDIGFVWVVPVFVMISGALILEPRQFSQGTIVFYRRRLVRLLPALVFWSLFYFIIVRTGLTGLPVTRADVARFLLEGRPYTHLYFLWLIIGLYAVAPVLAAFLRDGGWRRALVFAATALLATVFTGSAASLLTAMGDSRPLSLLALTQWLPYVGYFLAGWALRDVVLRGWTFALAATGTVILLAVSIAQYGLRPRLAILDALAPVSYFGPLVALAAIGVFVCTNSMLTGWTPGPVAGRVLREMSDSAFGVFLLHFAIMLVIRRVPPLAGGGGSLVLSFVELAITLVLSFVIVFALRRVPYLRRLV